MTIQVVTETRTTALGETLREWRNDARLTLDEMSLAVRQRAPHLRRISREYVRRYELGAIDRRFVDLPYLIFACKVLGHDARELGDDIAEWVDDLYGAIKPPGAPPFLNLSSKTPAKATPKKGARSGSRWMDATAA